LLCVSLKLSTSASFRAIQKIIVILDLCSDLSFKAPSHSTILLWVKKYGYYELSRTKPKADDWVIMVDESVQFGQNRLLLVFGIRQSEIDFSRPLNFQDLSPLFLASRPSWKGEDIQEQIQIIQGQIGTIIYAVADLGNPIKKAIRLMGLPHIYDITHAISLAIEHIYKQDDDFMAFTKRLGRLRASQALSKMAHVLPPVQRIKARFMNLRPISDWGMAVLRFLDDVHDRRFAAEKKNLKWVRKYESMIKELALLNKMVNEIQLQLKTNGLSKETIGECEKILQKGSQTRLCRFNESIKGYLHETEKLLPRHEKILCCTDILESSFGKYKNYLQANPMVGITNLSLSIPAFTAPLTPNEILAAFEQTKVQDVEKWTMANIGTTTLSKRMEVLKTERN
jgi:hypothetical protein